MYICIYIYIYIRHRACAYGVPKLFSSFLLPLVPLVTSNTH